MNKLLKNAFNQKHLNSNAGQITPGVATSKGLILIGNHQ